MNEKPDGIPEMNKKNNRAVSEKRAWLQEGGGERFRVAGCLNRKGRKSEKSVNWGEGSEVR